MKENIFTLPDLNAAKAANGSSMKLQVLIAAVNEDAADLATRMKLKTDAIIVNQCDRYSYEEFGHNGGHIRCYHMAERGVGLNRNTALMRAEGDICLFSDEDIVLNSEYEQKIVNAFSENPDADIITFNLKVDASRATFYNDGKRRIRWYNYGRYPTYSVAARTQAIRKANISFSLLFGGGAKYSNGEDSLFLHDCLKKGLHLYTSAEEIGEEIYRESTWFKGYNHKFFIDRGVLYHHLYAKMAKLFSLRFLYANRNEMCRETSVKEAYGLMLRGIREGKGSI